MTVTRMDLEKELAAAVEKQKDKEEELAAAVEKQKDKEEELMGYVKHGSDLLEDAEARLEKLQSDASYVNHRFFLF
jgi:Zn-dependent oligopeptidase